MQDLLRLIIVAQKNIYLVTDRFKYCILLKKQTICLTEIKKENENCSNLFFINVNKTYCI